MRTIQAATTPAMSSSSFTMNLLNEDEVRIACIQKNIYCFLGKAVGHCSKEFLMEMASEFC